MVFFLNHMCGHFFLHAHVTVNSKKPIMNWANFGTSLATAAVGVAAWGIATKALGEQADSTTGVAVRTVVTALVILLYVYIMNTVAPSYFCPAQVAVPLSPPEQPAKNTSGPADANADKTQNDSGKTNATSANQPAK